MHLGRREMYRHPIAFYLNCLDARVCVCNAYVYLKQFQLMERFSLGEQIQLPALCITVNVLFSNEEKKTFLIANQRSVIYRMLQTTTLIAIHCYVLF